MAEKEESTDEILDQDGLVIQDFEHTVLVVVPPEGYREETLRYARSSLLGVHVVVQIAKRLAGLAILSPRDVLRRPVHV